MLLLSAVPKANIRFEPLITNSVILYKKITRKTKQSKIKAIFKMTVDSNQTYNGQKLSGVCLEQNRSASVTSFLAATPTRLKPRKLQLMSMFSWRGAKICFPNNSSLPLVKPCSLCCVRQKNSYCIRKALCNRI